MTAKKILFTGYYGFNNFGDDLFVLACVNGLKELGGKYLPVILAPPISGIDDAFFLVPSILRSFYNRKNFIGKILRVIFMIYGCLRYKQVVLAGGSVVSSESSLRMNKIQYFFAKTGFCRLTAIGISIGPFSSENDKAKAEKFINILTHLSVRDKASMEEIKKMTIKIDVKLHNDIAGCVPLPLIAKKRMKDKIIGVSICRYESLMMKGDVKKELLRNIAIFCGIADFAIKHGMAVNILILNAHKSVGDTELSEELFSYLSQNNIRAEIIRYSNPVESLRNISMCDIFFSVRLHGAISAYLLNVPFVLVEYHRKCTDFLDYIGFYERNRISNIDKINVSNTLEDIYQNGLICSIAPLEYILESKKIFPEANSIWSQ